MTDACTTCGRNIEVCFVCEREDCPEGLCYRCVVIELRQFLPQPHPHGG